MPKDPAGVWEGIRNAVDEMAGMHVKVGALQSKGGGADHGDGITMIELLAIHELGAPRAGIPARRPLQTTFKSGDSQQKLHALQAKLLKALLSGRLTPQQAYSLLGEGAVAMVRHTITSTDLPPPLQPETIARKGSTRPLVDTGRLVQSIAYEVVDD